MFALVKNDGSITLFAPYTIWEDKNGTQYSPDSLLTLTQDQKQDLGIYDVAYGTRGDDRFYNIVDQEPEFDAQEKIVKISYSSTPKTLEDDAQNNGLKTVNIEAVKRVANLALSQTDWMLVRKIERNIDVPAETITARAAIVAEANRKEAAIAASTNIEELIAAVNSSPSAE
jgi:hypothetical protein